MKKILIIEDNDSLREEVTDWFMFEGFESFSADNGSKGVELAIKNQPDLILCDIMMPGMDGKEVLNKLRNNPATRLIPFIFITALTERNNIRTGMDLGADDYITKPFSRKELLIAVNTRLEKSDRFAEKTEQELSNLRNNLLLNLPHELRTPLNGIIGFGQMLKDDPGSFTIEDLGEIGDHIYQSGNRLFHLIKNYLIFVELELNKIVVPADCELIDQESNIRKTAVMVAQRHDRQEDLCLDLQPGTVGITQNEYCIIIEELTDNAFKFSAKGQMVTVRTWIENGIFRLTIADLGRGIAPADQQKIGAFIQFDRKKYEQQGSGFGLIISKKLTELFHGNLKIQSSPGEGTTVSIELPGK